MGQPDVLIKAERTVARKEDVSVKLELAIKLACKLVEGYALPLPPTTPPGPRECDSQDASGIFEAISKF